MPAAAASSPRRWVSTEPTPFPCRSSTTANATSAISPSRTSRAIPTGSPPHPAARPRGSPPCRATSTWWSPSTRASCWSSAGVSTFFAPPNRRRRERGPSRSKTVCTTAVSPFRSDRTVIPLIPSAFMSLRLPARDGPARRPQGPSFREGPVGPLVLAYMDQNICFLDFEGRELAYSTYGEGPPIVVGPRWVSHLEEEWSDP